MWSQLVQTFDIKYSSRPGNRNFGMDTSPNCLRSFIKMFLNLCKEKDFFLKSEILILTWTVRLS